MKRLNNRGLSVTELIVAFVLCMLVFIFIMQVVSSIQELHLNLGVKTELLNKQSLISEKINEKLNSNNIVLIKKCGNDCYTFIYKDNTYDKMEINKTNNTFTFGLDVYNFNNLGTVSNLDIINQKDNAYNHGILTINLNIKNSIFESGTYLIKAYYQYNETETIYNDAVVNKPEIYLFGSASDYNYSNNVYEEPGYMVYYPSGEVTINGNDVSVSSIQYDSNGQAYITYTGINNAVGATARRNLKKILNAKEHILSLYESNQVHLYSGTGKYVYKGLNPNNYILVGSKLFRILDLEVQNNYKLDSNNNIIDAEVNKEDKYLLKVVSNDYLADTSNNINLPYGITEDDFTTSAWIYNDNTKYANRLANQIYLGELINTGTGRTQIKNGIFHTGLVDNTEYNFSNEYDAKRIYDEEGLDKTDPGTWSGCTSTKCEPNAGLLTLTDVLFAGLCTDDVSINSCLTNNWIIRDSEVIRLMTRSNENETWVLNGSNLVSRGIDSELKSRVTLYLDANLYLIGDGTIENPYELYNLN